MNFITFINPALTMFAWTIWGLSVFVIVTSVLVSKFKEACKVYFEHKLGFFQALHKQSQEDADEISARIWQKTT